MQRLLSRCVSACQDPSSRFTSKRHLSLIEPYRLPLPDFAVRSVVCFSKVCVIKLVPWVMPLTYSTCLCCAVYRLASSSNTTVLLAPVCLVVKSQFDWIIHKKVTSSWLVKGVRVNCEEKITHVHESYSLNYKLYIYYWYPTHPVHHQQPDLMTWLTRIKCWYSEMFSKVVFILHFGKAPRWDLTFRHVVYSEILLTVDEMSDYLLITSHPVNLLLFFFLHKTLDHIFYVQFGMGQQCVLVKWKIPKNAVDLPHERKHRRSY